MDKKSIEFGTRQMQISQMYDLDLNAMQAYRTSLYEIRLREYLDSAIEPEDFSIFFEHLKPWFANLWSGLDTQLLSTSDKVINKLKQTNSNWWAYCTTHNYAYYSQFHPSKEDIEALVRHFKNVKQILKNGE